MSVPVILSAVMLFLLAVALWTLPTRSRRAAPEPTASMCGYLRGGAREAVLVTLVALHLRGGVAPARRGGLKSTGRLVGSTDLLEGAVYGALRDPLGLRAIRARKRVIEACSETGKRLVRGGLLLPMGRWLLLRLTAVAVLTIGLAGLIAGAPAMPGMVVFTVLVFAGLGLLCLPRRSRAGGRALAVLRREYPLDGELSAMTVAAHGTGRVEGVPGYLTRRGRADGGDYGDSSISGMGTAGGLN